MYCPLQVDTVDDYLQIVQDTTRRVFDAGDYDEDGDHGSSGLGVVQGAVIRATNLPVDASGACDSYVKISAVEPGKGPIMFRCKTPIHTTDVVHGNTNPDYTNNSFSFQTEEDLAGDLLFSVYETSKGHSRVIGQYVMPLHDLVDSEGKASGKQRMLQLQPTLNTQQGDSTDSQVHISLQLILPPERTERQIGAKALQLQQKLAAQKGQRPTAKVN